MNSKFLSAACEILNMSKEDISKYAIMDHFQADRMLKDAWDRVNPKSEEEIIKYYTLNPEFTLFHLRFIYNMDDNFSNSAFFNRIIALIPDVRNYKILDYGCGSGQAGITFANSGCNQVYLADIPLPLFQIVKKMYSGRGINFIEINEKFSLKDMYDLIICIDVLEHVVQPDMVLKHLVEHLNNGKFLYIETFFGGYDHAPYHLEENNKFIPIWKDVIHRCGLEAISINDEGGSNGLYKKVNN